MKAKKSLGQHFLTSGSALAAIISASEVKKGEDILEIGPGKGILTRALLEAGARVTAVEKDEGLAEFLKQTFADDITHKRLRLIVGDMLLLSEKKLGLSAYKVVANIPYYITGKLLRQIFSAKKLPSRVVLLVQKEVALRAAKEKKESILSLSLKCYGTPHYIKTVPAGSFSPPPRVDSAILSIEGVSRAFFTHFSEEFWFELLKRGFGQKRKKLIRNLEPLFGGEELKNAFSALSLSPNTRAEELSLAKWQALATHLSSVAPSR